MVEILDWAILVEITMQKASCLSFFGFEGYFLSFFGTDGCCLSSLGTDGFCLSSLGTDGFCLHHAAEKW
jgi:hypothetical protein